MWDRSIPTGPTRPSMMVGKFCEWILWEGNERRRGKPTLASTTVDDFVIDITGRVELVERSVGQSVGGLGELLSTEELPKKPFALAAYITGASVECNSKPMCFKIVHLLRKKEFQLSLERSKWLVGRIGLIIKIISRTHT